MDKKYWKLLVTANIAATIFIYGLFASALFGQVGWTYAAMFIGGCVLIIYLALIIAWKKNSKPLNKLLEKARLALVEGYSMEEIKQSLYENHNKVVVDDVMEKLGGEIS